jgi:putative ABC transport system permease protein
MSLWRQLSRGLRVLTRRPEADRELDDEVNHYLAAATAEGVARGLTPEAAGRAARLELGSATALKQEVRAGGWEVAVGTLFADLRYAGRRLASNPGFSAITIATLALGIGGTTAIFSALNPILFESLPYPDAGRVTALIELGTDGSHRAGTFGMYHALAERTRSFEAMAVVRGWQPISTGLDQAERVDGQLVSARYFQVLGVAPALGRDFQQAEDRRAGPSVVVLSDALWRRRFGGDRNLVGHEIRLNDQNYTVIGIMPRGFENVLAPGAELWAPLQYDISEGRAWGHHLQTVGRLRGGVGLDQATTEINDLGRQVLAEQRPETYDPDTRFVVASLRDELTRGVRPALLAIMGGVFLVLVIACVNVTNLLLARGVQRRGEFALRAALGAARGRLIRQLLTESVVLAVVGGMAGMAVAVLGVRALVALSPAGLPRDAAIRVDGAVFAFGLTITTAIGLAFGLIPALQAARSDPHQDLGQGSRRATGGHRRTRALLVVAEVALALMLLVGSGLLLRSLKRLFAVEVGFDPSRMLTMQVMASGTRYQADSTRYRFFEQALDAVRRLPGVTGAALTSQLPLSGDLDEYGAIFEANPGKPAAGYNSFRYGVTPGYTEMMGIPLLRGRSLSEQDKAGAPPVALISASLARRKFPDADPVGQRVTVGNQPSYTIVGVVGDVRQASLAESQTDAVYLPTRQWQGGEVVMSLVVRARGNPESLAPDIRRAIESVDRDQPVMRVATMDNLLATSAADRRFALVLFGAFAAVALVLAAAGIYGVLSGSVTERTREIGVRSALGASRSEIRNLVLRQGMGLAAVGGVIGLAGSALASQAIATMLFGVSRLDPLTYLAVVALLAGVAALACWLPAWRAARIDPVITLRSE